MPYNNATGNINLNGVSITNVALISSSTGGNEIIFGTSSVALAAATIAKITVTSALTTMS